MDILDLARKSEIIFDQQKEIERLQVIVDNAVALAEYYAPLLHGKRAQEFLDSLREDEE